MRSDERRATKIIEAANKAISKMSDPMNRNAAKAKLALAQKKMTEASRQAKTAPTRAQQLQHREVDYDR